MSYSQAISEYNQAYEKIPHCFIAFVARRSFLYRRLGRVSPW